MERPVARLMAAAIWALLSPPRAEQGHAAAPDWSLWRSWRAWEVTFFMGLQSSLAYIVFGNFAGATTLIADWMGGLRRLDGMPRFAKGTIHASST